MMRARIILAGLAAAPVVFAGCVERTITITSDPSGALVWLNDREIGRTPVDTEFVFYGTYDVRLEKDGYEPLLTKGDASPPWWDNIPLDFAAELAPVELHADLNWHYQMEPARDEREALIDRAGELRQRVDGEDGPATQPATDRADGANTTEPPPDDSD